MKPEIAKRLAELVEASSAVLAEPARKAFAKDAQRFARFHIVFNDLLFDYSKQRVTSEIMAGLVELAKSAGVEARRDAMFAGDIVNPTEKRAALHRQVARIQFWDWVGGRYSIWSSIGLPLAIAIGAENYLAFLRGAFEVDQHFLSTPIETNIPMLMGLLSIWNRNVLKHATQAIIAYDQRLSRFAAYLQ